MAKQVYQQASKEFQMKVVWPLPGSKKKREPGETDRAIFQHVAATLQAVVTTLAAGKKSDCQINDNLWRREGIRYDTATGDLKQHQLTLAIEATDARTKLKCKQHSFIPELLFSKPQDSICHPDAKRAAEYKQHDAKFKLEEDLHFSNLKYCASGSLFIKGRQTEVSNLDYFSHYFPALDQLIPPTTPLQPVSRWDEAIFDDMRVSWGKTKIDSWMLVNRWDWTTHELLEAELSFKIAKDYDAAWDVKQLAAASQLYVALQKSGAFRPVPPIFFYDNPVSSVPVALLP
jgi:hypothetical protein